LLEVYGNPNPFRISKLTINQVVYPFQVELLVDFVTKIGKVNKILKIIKESIRKCEFITCQLQRKRSLKCSKTIIYDKLLYVY